MPRDVIQFRSDPDLNRMLDELIERFRGPFAPATQSAVIREAIKRLHASEIAKIADPTENPPPKKKPKKMS